MKTGIELIAEERQRQIQKGYDAKHDDAHTNGVNTDAARELLRHALNPGCVPLAIGNQLKDEQWQLGILKKHERNPIKLYAIAGALIASEIDRLQRQKELPRCKCGHHAESHGSMGSLSDACWVDDCGCHTYKPKQRPEVKG